MPNTNISVGARPHERVNQAHVYTAESTIFKGDFVKKNANGTVERATAGAPMVGCALTNVIAGQEVLVADHPDQTFSIQASGVAPSAQTDIGLNYSILPGTPNVTYMRSSMQLDSATGAVTAGLELRLIGLDRSVGNALGTNAKCLVKINAHQNSTAVAGV